MLEFVFKSILVSSAVGTLLFIIFDIVKPLTRKVFSPSWHYYISYCCPAQSLPPSNSAFFPAVFGFAYRPDSFAQLSRTATGSKLVPSGLRPSSNSHGPS